MNNTRRCRCSSRAAVPFQCEFCDIITIYGRNPRAKTPAQVIAELDALGKLGWRNEVFIVDDNFIGNHKKHCS